MNKYLFAYNIRQNALLFLIILSVLLLYFSIIIPMYDPAGNEDLIAMASMKMSPEMLKAFGFTITPNNVSLTPFLASYLYGMLMIIIPMIYPNSVIGFGRCYRNIFERFAFSPREYSGLYDRKEDAKKPKRNDNHPKSTRFTRRNVISYALMTDLGLYEYMCKPARCSAYR